jgi:uncharacterized protein involved in copper resistance
MKLNKLKIILLAGFVAGIIPAFAQHEHHQPVKDSTQQEMHHMQDMKAMDHEGMDHKAMQHGTSHMTHSLSLSLPMTRNGSGTGWQPDATPMYAYMKHANKWNYMLHGSIYLRYTAQNFNNGGRMGSSAKFSVPNWFIGYGAAASRKKWSFKCTGDGFA